LHAQPSLGQRAGSAHPSHASADHGDGLLGFILLEQKASQYRTVLALLISSPPVLPTHEE
jgi:hypothetical protein